VGLLVLITIPFYYDSRHVYFQSQSGIYIYPDTGFIQVGEILSAELFSKLIAEMKQAAENLLAIRKQVADYVVKEITI
jgi:hypothetical protein